MLNNSNKNHILFLELSNSKVFLELYSKIVKTIKERKITIIYNIKCKRQFIWLNTVQR